MFITDWSIFSMLHVANWASIPNEHMRDTSISLPNHNKQIVKRPMKMFSTMYCYWSIYRELDRQTTYNKKGMDTLHPHRDISLHILFIAPRRH